MNNTRIENMFIGLSLADALGVPVEFQKRQTLIENPVKEMRSHGTYNQVAGTWSDDSSLTFCLADSLCNGYNLQDIALKFVLWTNEQIWTPHGKVFDIGNQTQKAIHNLSMNIDDVETLKLLKYEQDEYSNGNGSLMRILPLVYHIKGKPIDQQFEIIWETSALTHPHIRSAISCLIYLKFAEFLLIGCDLSSAYIEMKKVIIPFLIKKSFAKSEIERFDRLLSSDISTLNIDKIQSSGYVIHTLEASFWCLLNTNTYLDSIFKAINLGEDTDTTATVVGGIAGLFYGLQDVPKEWINQLAKLDDIKNLSKRFEKKYQL